MDVLQLLLVMLLSTGGCDVAKSEPLKSSAVPIVATEYVCQRHSFTLYQRECTNGDASYLTPPFFLKQFPSEATVGLGKDGKVVAGHYDTPIYLPTCGEGI